MDADQIYKLIEVSFAWVLTTVHWLAENKVLLATVVGPVLASGITYKATMRSAAVAELARVDTRQLAERQIVHTENVDQTDAMTRAFKAIMDAQAGRVDDLMHEVTSLRLEVTSLRKVLDKQRTLCHGCERFSLWNIEAASAANT